MAAKKPKEDKRTPFDRFQQITRALFRVDKRDVPKHEPAKRAINSKPAGR